MDVDSEPVSRLKRKRSDERFALRYVTAKRKLFLQDGECSSGNAQSRWSSDVRYITMKISVGWPIVAHAMLN